MKFNFNQWFAVQYFNIYNIPNNQTKKAEIDMESDGQKRQQHMQTSNVGR